MQIENYLRKHQPIIYKTFVNALTEDHLSHAYLISGAPGTPLIEVAKFLAKSIICDDPDPLACNSCITCLRVDDNNYPDFIVFDGSQKTIKKEEVTSIETQFDKEAFESKGIMIYILHLVENMTTVAVNSILKFLEEPGKNIYAFLTTNNESLILPTIVSRCQCLKLKPVDRNEVINAAMEIGVAQDDAELLSYFYNDEDIIQKFLESEDKDFYLDAKETTNELLEALKQGKDEAIFVTQSKIGPMIKSKESMRFFLDILAQFFEDILNIKNGNETFLVSYDTILRGLLDKLPHVEQSLIEILKCRNITSLNVNNSLLLDHLILKITEETSDVRK